MCSSKQNASRDPDPCGVGGLVFESMMFLCVCVCVCVREEERVRVSFCNETGVELIN